MHTELANIESTIQERDGVISRLSSEINALKNNQIEWELALSNK
jgi:hypothetical protein